MRGTEGDSESVLLAEYTKTDLYTAADEKVTPIAYFGHLELLRRSFDKQGWVILSVYSLTAKARSTPSKLV